MKLTEYQKSFLLSFFENEKYVGWKNIASALLETGKCIVAGNYRIWKGGIGNFIKTEKAENSYDCTLYTFDIETFLSSELYIEARDIYFNRLQSKLNELELEFSEISEICRT